MSSAECTVCGLKFSNDRAFDHHRVGSFEPDARRCLTVAQMEAGEPVPASGRRVPWRLNHRGWWTDQEADSRFSVGGKVDV